MPLPSTMGFAFAPADLTAINDAITALLTTINAKGTVNLTKDERQAATTVAAIRYPYVEKTYVTLAPAYPTLQPPFGNFNNSQRDFQYMNHLRDLLIRLNQVLEIYSDHSLSAENLAYEYMLDFYNTAKAGAKRNVPGADTCIDELAPLFERTTLAPNPANPPVPGEE